MKELINQNLVIFDADVSSKEEVIDLMAQVMDQDGRLADKNQYVNDVLKRENDASTAVGFSFATPHAKSDGVATPSLGYMSFKKPFKWDDDSDEVSSIFMIGVPSDDGEQHLEILAAIFRNLVHEEFRNNLASATSPDQVVALIESLYNN